MKCKNTVLILITALSVVSGFCINYFDFEKIDTVYEDNTYECNTWVSNSRHWYEKKININTADRDLLCTIDGIGESIADGIIEYRNEYGKFKSIDEIKNVFGIGEKKFEKMQEYICIE